jgi:hypothetical protein
MKINLYSLVQAKSKRKLWMIALLLGPILTAASCGGSSEVSVASNATAATVTSASTSGSTATTTSTGTTNAASTNAGTSTGTLKNFKAQMWADNWFSLHVGETYVGEDSVPITTERSFNSETLNFSASYPFDLNFIIKDYKQNDTGLEYIGTAKQQIGDGGFIAQITDTSTGRIVAVTSSAFKCKVIHKAPLVNACAKEASPTVQSCGATILSEPVGWKSTGFNTTGWESAAVYTAAQVGVKDGYYDIAWDAAAKLIWTSDLLSDNTLLCKATVTSP